MNRISVPKQEWDEKLANLLTSSTLYAPVKNEFSCDYVKVGPEVIPEIVYNQPKPVTPLKQLFLPVKENVTIDNPSMGPRVILGAPNCDVMALAYLDEIYLDPDFPDPYYRKWREHTTLIATDCLSILEHCHCTSYGIEPVGNDRADLSLALVQDHVILTVFSEKGEALLDQMGVVVRVAPDEQWLSTLEENRKQVRRDLEEQNRLLPGFEETGELVSSANGEIWKKYASTCVSCGACSAICPTCSCFLLIDRPGFEKVRQLDTCQYPGFERVAGGEDALGPLPERFRNRYMCKYVWKPEKYTLKSCTGCGRCIETCIGEINKNELIIELSN